MNPDRDIYGTAPRAECPPGFGWKRPGLPSAADGRPEESERRFHGFEKRNERFLCLLERRHFFRGGLRSFCAENETKERGFDMKLIKTEDAVGQVLCHDITQIIKGYEGRGVPEGTCGDSGGYPGAVKRGEGAPLHMGKG